MLLVYLLIGLSEQPEGVISESTCCAALHDAWLAMSAETMHAASTTHAHTGA